MVPADDAVGRIAQSAQQMPAIGGLHRIGGTKRRPFEVAITAVAADDFDWFICLQPRLERFGRLFFNQVHRPRWFNTSRVTLTRLVTHPCPLKHSIKRVTFEE